MAGLLDQRKPTRGLLDIAKYGDGGLLSSYEPSLRDKVNYWLADHWYGDTRQGVEQAKNLSNVLETVTPYGLLTGAYDAGRSAASGDYLSGGSGIAMAMVPMAAAVKTPVKRAAMEADQTLMKAISQTKGARMMDEGLALNVTRNQHPNQAMEESIRGGVFYLPEGSKDQKFYTGTGHNYAYGGTERISGETLYKNPLVAKGATGGKAPEAAFDILNGKGAYQKMRSDALQAIPPYYIKDNGLKRESISAFLEKYAPEMADKVDVILQNTTKGNQLAYALQEAAVASAARRAGHDGIIGYSVSRKTKEPFISEIFDVREDRYPNATGGYSMWPEYEQN